jgi:hypothetical protein
VIADSSAESTKNERVELLHSVLMAPKSNPPDELWTASHSTMPVGSSRKTPT